MKKIIDAIRNFFKEFVKDWKEGAKIADQIMKNKKEE